VYYEHALFHNKTIIKNAIKTGLVSELKIIETKIILVKLNKNELVLKLKLTLKL